MATVYVSPRTRRLTPEDDFERNSSIFLNHKAPVYQFWIVGFGFALKMEGFGLGIGRITSFQIVEGIRRIIRYSDEMNTMVFMDTRFLILDLASLIFRLPSILGYDRCFDGPPGAGFPSLGGKRIRIPTVRLSWTK